MLFRSPPDSSPAPRPPLVCRPFLPALRLANPLPGAPPKRGQQREYAWFQRAPFTQRTAFLVQLDFPFCRLLSATTEKGRRWQIQSHHGRGRRQRGSATEEERSKRGVRLGQQEDRRRKRARRGCDQVSRIVIDAPCGWEGTGTNWGGGRSRGGGIGLSSGTLREG